jgi:hypothetical protein
MGHFQEQGSIFPCCMKRFPGFYGNLYPAMLFLHLFCAGGIIPETGGDNLFFEFNQTLFFAVYIKDAPLMKEYGLLNPAISASALLT